MNRTFQSPQPLVSGLALVFVLAMPAATTPRADDACVKACAATTTQTFFSSPSPSASACCGYFTIQMNVQSVNGTCRQSTHAQCTPCTFSVNVSFWTTQSCSPFNCTSVAGRYSDCTGTTTFSGIDGTQYTSSGSPYPIVTLFPSLGCSSGSCTMSFEVWDSNDSSNTTRLDKALLCGACQ